MALLQILLGGRRRKGFKLPGEEAIGLEMDVVFREGISLSSVVTRNGVEDRGFVSDHVTDNPERVTLDGFITRTPIDPLRILTGATLGDPVADAYELLRKLHADKEPLAYVSGLDVHEDMVLVGLDFPRDRQTGRALMFTATLEKVHIVGSEEAEVVRTAVPAKATKKKELGPQPSLQSKPIVDATGNDLTARYAPDLSFLGQ